MVIRRDAWERVALEEMGYDSRFSLLVPLTPPWSPRHFLKTNSVHVLELTSHGADHQKHSQVHKPSHRSNQLHRPAEIIIETQPASPQHHRAGVLLGLVEAEG